DRGVVHVLPLRLLHLEPMSERLQTPLQHELGLVLLGRDQADDLLAEPARSRVRLDGGDESVLVLALRELLDFFGGGHGAPQSLAAADGRLISFLRAACTSGGAGWTCETAMSDRVSFSSVSRMARLMLRQPLRFGHTCSRLHKPSTSELHSVIAIGPSRAAIAWATEMSEGCRASV